MSDLDTGASSMINMIFRYLGKQSLVTVRLLTRFGRSGARANRDFAND
jgi:hypothetical protein